MVVVSCDSFINDLRKNGSYSSNIHYYDNSGKFGSRFVEGANSVWLGDMGGCILDGMSRYCVWDFTVKQAGKGEVFHRVLWGVCVPSSCNESIKSNFGDFNRAFFDSKLQLIGSDVQLSCNKQLDPTVGYYVLSVLLLLLLLLCLASTAVTYWYESDAQMKYSFVYRSGPRDVQVVRPSVRVRAELGFLGPGEEEDNPASNEGACAGRESFEEIQDLGVEASIPLIPGSSGGTLESPRGSGEDGASHDTPSNNSGGQRETGTFGPPSEELLEKAFKYRPNPVTKFCYNFCPRANLSRLSERSLNRLPVLDFIRVSSFMLLMFAQLFVCALQFGLIGTQSFEKNVARKSPWSYAFLCHSLAIDSIFFVSGFLSIKKSIKKWQELVKFLVRRYLRLYVPLLFALLLTIVLYPEWTKASGPLAYSFAIAGERCSKLWIKIALGVQNFPVGEECDNFEWCIPWSWMVASLWQLSLCLSFIFFYVKGRVFVSCHVLLVACSMVCVATLVAKLNLNPNFFENLEAYYSNRNSMKQYADLILMKPYTYLVSYSLGVLLSHGLQAEGRAAARATTEGADDNNNNNRVVGSCSRRLCSKKVCSWLGLTGFLLVLGGFLGLQGHILSVERLGEVGNIFSGTIFHLLWPLALAWFIHDVHRGRGGIFASFCTLRVWTYPGQLVYSAFVVHGFVVPFVCSVWTSAIYPEDGTSMVAVVLVAVVVVAVTVAVAVVVYFPISFFCLLAAHHVLLRDGADLHLLPCRVSARRGSVAQHAVTPRGRVMTRERSVIEGSLDGLTSFFSHSRGGWWHATL